MEKYLYADESGNLDFRDPARHPRGPSRHFVMGTVVVEGPRALTSMRVDLEALRYRLLRERPTFEGFFHASDDEQAIRDAVFDVLRRHDFGVDVTVLGKAAVPDDLRRDHAAFYRHAWGQHFSRLARDYFGPEDEVTLVNAGYGTKRLRRAFRESIESVVDEISPEVRGRTVAFWDTRADVMLQAADYVTWAVARHRERGDDRSQRLIASRITSVRTV